jgi:predicted transcriptional regulator
MASPTNVRFPDPLDKRLGEYARKIGARKSTVVVSALNEWLRMEAHPGIVFVTTTTGERRAALTTGPQVWVVAESWLQHDRDERTPEVVADASGLTVHDVEVALDYWADHRQEIDELIERQQAEQDAALAAWERRRALDAV